MKYIQYELELLQPLKITDVDISKSGEMDIVSYIPGSSIRGAILGKFVMELNDKSQKTVLLSDKVCFLNAYPMINNKKLYPSPKGFYEDKLSQGNMENMFVEKKHQEGTKRANLGQFSYIEGDTIHYMSVRKKDALGIDVENKKIFRSITLAEGQRFKAEIIVDEAVEKLIRDALTDTEIILGSSKTSGYGKCRIHVVDNTADVDLDVPFTVKGDAQDVYMMLLANTSMRNSIGEICGIDWDILADMLDAGKLEVKKAASSICKVSGVNRTWKCRTQEVTMYQAGSIFKLHFENKVSKEKFEQLMLKGIGEYRTQGCGRICFVSTEDFEKINQKKECIKTIKIAEGTASELTDNQRKMVAKRMAQKKVQNALQHEVMNSQAKYPKIGMSQRGIMLNMAKNLKYSTVSAMDELDAYIKHEQDKISSRKRQKVGKENGKDEMINLLQSIRSEDIFDVLNLKQQKVMNYSVESLFTEDEIIKIKFELLEGELTYASRKERAKNG